MGEIVRIGGSDNRFASEFFARHIWARETLAKTGAALAHLCKYTNPVKIAPVETKFPFKRPEDGMVAAATTENNPAIGVDGNYVRALEQHTDLSYDDAIDLAASFACAFSYIYPKLQVRKASEPRPRATAATFRPDLWDKKFSSADGLLRPLPYRMSASVALTACGFEEPLVYSADLPHPAHIAALENPLPTDEIVGHSHRLKP